MKCSAKSLVRERKGPPGDGKPKRRRSQRKVTRQSSADCRSLPPRLVRSPGHRKESTQGAAVGFTVVHPPPRRLMEAALPSLHSHRGWTTYL